MTEEKIPPTIPTWRYLWEMKIAAQSVSEVYVSVSVLGGHYVKIAAKDFLDAINDMQMVSDTHPHPKRFQFTLEKGVLWVHSSKMPRGKSNAENMHNNSSHII